MASQLDPSKTPTKISKFVNISPKSKGCICIVCGKFIEISTYRRKLFIGSNKTDICGLIEKVLNVTIYRECSTHTVCRKCAGEVTRVNNLICRLIESFEKTATYLYQSHGGEVTKRLRSGEDQAEFKDSRRKSLFQDSTPESSLASNTVTCDLGYSRQSDNVKVTIVTPDGFQRIVVHSLAPLALALSGSNFKGLSTILFSTEELQPYIISNFCNQIQKEISAICSKRDPSILRSTNASNLLSLSWEKIANEWKVKAPTYWAILQVFSSNPSLQRNRQKDVASLLPAIVSAGSKLISVYNRDLNALQHLNSIILLKGGAKKSLFNRLSVTNDCTSYASSMKDVESFSKEWNGTILEWQKQCEEDHVQEHTLHQNVLDAQQLLEGSGASPESVLLLDQEQNALFKHRKLMHEGYYFVGDNVDFYTKVRNMSSTNQNKSQHMFQMCAYKNRVSGNTLDDSHPKADPKTIRFSALLPNAEEQSILVSELAFIVAKKWAEFIPSLHAFAPVLPEHISHKYMKEMRQKTERINLGVLEKNEQYNDEMTDICEFLHTFVPGHDEGDDWTRATMKIFSGGDYLTFERHKQAQTGKANGRTPTKRLQGLVPKMEEFHNQAEFLKLIWSLLYKTNSSTSIGTLFAARNKINARNVPTDPHENFYAASGFLDKVTPAYIIAGGLHYFQMETINSKPEPEYAGPVGDKEAMKEYLMDHAIRFVEDHGKPNVPNLPEYGLQSNACTCRYCGKVYVRPKVLRKHEAQTHNHYDPKYSQEEAATTIAESGKSTVYDYTKLCLTLGLLRLNHNDAIRMGDGDRMMRIAKFFCLYYKSSKCPKYAFGLLETIAQSEVLLSERQAERLKWNRTVNHQGKADTNHPNDLDLEHCNKVFKDDVHTYRGKYTEKTILRVSRGALTTDKICQKYDKLTNVRQNAGKHKKADMTDDILSLTNQFHTRKVYVKDDTRVSEHFPNLNDPLASLDMEQVQSWISESLEKFKGKLYYH